MKRTPLKRKTPLKPGKWTKKVKPTEQLESAWPTRSLSKPLLRSGKLKSGKPLKKRSNKREIQEKEYSRLRRQFLLENPVCAVFKHLQATQIHHAKGRYGHYLDVSSWIPVSDEGHRFIHNNPAIAKDRGWLIYGKDAK